MKKRILAVALAGSLLLGSVGTNAKTFQDTTGHWAQQAINRVTEQGLFSGVSDTEFAPDSPMSRGMLVTVLGRLAGADVAGKTPAFSDVAPGSYYAGYVQWAYENNLVSGVGDNRFAPDNSITRQELAVMFYNYCNFAGKRLTKIPFTTFSDKSVIADWALPAVEAMQRAEIMTGKDGNMFDPAGRATRAEVSVMLQRLDNLVDLADLSAAAAAPIVSDEPAEAALFFEDGNRYAISVPNDATYGSHFSATAPFDCVRAACPSYSNNVGNIRLTLVPWMGDFEKSLAAKPIATVLYENFSDNATLSLEFDEQQPGEYMLLFHDTTETVGIWVSQSADPITRVYEGELEKEGDYLMYIRYTKTPERMYNKAKSMIDLDYFVTPPEESTVSANSAMVARDVMPDTWVATDGLGRTLPTYAEVGAPRENRSVGLFYWTWHGSMARSHVPHNVQQILDENPDAEDNLNHPAWGPIGLYHHWNEPIWGYYSTNDKWVLRKQAEMLAAAGVDVVFFDNTNGTFTWRDSYTALFEAWSEAKDDGVDVPKVSFMLPFWDRGYNVTQLLDLYKDIYRPGKYQDLWFYWDGKPMLMAFPDGLNPDDQLQDEILKFFTYRQGQPAYNETQVYTPSWGWLAVYPQQVYRDKDGNAEQMAVGVAQNWVDGAGLAVMNAPGAFGRTHTSKGVDTRENAVLYGANFEEQFEYALEVDPKFIFVTGWNEWVAGRAAGWGGTAFSFPDQYNDEFSRDIEPTKGKLQDHYYYQFVSYVRQYKGVRPVPEASEAKTIDIGSAQDQWADVAPSYYAYQGNTMHRDADGYVGMHYTNDTGRNDIVLAKVAQDAEAVYFMVETAEALTPQTDASWMRLLLDTNSSDANWEGYEFIVNRETGKLERSTGGWSWEAVCAVDYTVSGNRLQIKIPRSALGIGDGPFTVNFKWVDNMQNDGDIMDFYVSGDVAPLGRFMYQYNSK